MNNTDFMALSADESADINGGYGWMLILGATVILVAKECITNYREFENGVIAGYNSTKA